MSASQLLDDLSVVMMHHKRWLGEWCTMTLFLQTTLYSNYQSTSSVLIK